MSFVEDENGKKWNVMLSRFRSTEATLLGVAAFLSIYFLSRIIILPLLYRCEQCICVSENVSITCKSCGRFMASVDIITGKLDAMRPKVFSCGRMTILKVVDPRSESSIERVERTS